MSFSEYTDVWTAARITYFSRVDFGTVEDLRLLERQLRRTTYAPATTHLQGAEREAAIMKDARKRLSKGGKTPIEPGKLSKLWSSVKGKASILKGKLEKPLLEAGFSKSTANKIAMSAAVLTITGLPGIPGSGFAMPLAPKAIASAKKVYDRVKDSEKVKELVASFKSGLADPKTIPKKAWQGGKKFAAKQFTVLTAAGIPAPIAVGVVALATVFAVTPLPAPGLGQISAVATIKGAQLAAKGVGGIRKQLKKRKEK